MPIRISIIAFAIVLVSNVAAWSQLQSWETYRRDSKRSGVVETELTPTGLKPAWSWNGELKPFPAWDGPARWDAYNLVHDLPAMRQYDACFYPVSDGKIAVFGSSSQDFVKAVDLQTGKLIWQFNAGGPVRLAPTIDGDKVLFGCDDGFAYCLNKSNGKQIWKFSPSIDQGAEQLMLINNDRLISYYPIRTGVIVRDNIAYFGASMLPWRESYLCAINVETGKDDESKSTYVTRHEDATLEGNLLIADDRLIVPQGRIAPLLFDRSTGAKKGSLPGGGGVTAVVTDEGDVVRAEGGKPSRAGQMAVFQGKERVASFPRGRAIAISGSDFFVIDGQKLFAASRDTNELRWSCEVDEPLELIKVGNAIIVGGDRHVTGVNAFDGSVLWSAEVVGRAFGLSFAKNHLMVSTDQGHIHAFELVNSKLEIASEKDSSNTENKAWKSPPVPKVRKKNLLHRWVFHRAGMTKDGAAVEDRNLQGAVVKDHASGVDLTLKGTGTAIRINDSEKLEGVAMSGGYFPHKIENTESLPRDAITVEAWVRVDVPQQWGSVIGCFQDDGNTEHGWTLGYKNDQFYMAVAGGGSGMTYLTSNNAFESRSWNHVVGTYNGNETRIYVNGSLAGSTNSEQGPISYSDSCFFTVGSYRDSDEDFPLQGALQEVRVYGKAISASDVTRLFEASANEFGVTLGASKKTKTATKPVDELPQNFLAWGPYTKFVRPGEIEVNFGTHENGPSVVDVIMESGVRRIKNDDQTTNHRVIIKDLPHKRQLQFQISQSADDAAEKTESFLIDTHFDWTETLPMATPNAFVSELIEKGPNTRGMVLVVGADQQQKAKDIAKQSDFLVVLVEPDEDKATKLKDEWSQDAEVVYGPKFCVVNRSLDDLPSAFASTVVAAKTNSEVRRLVRPQGGLLHDGESVVWQRGGLKGSGTWSHMYGSADNSAYGGEALSGISDRNQLRTQWIGRPGPRYQTDRQNRKPSPLAAGGRIFLQGQQRMIALDNYSGAVLWSVESPTVMRWNVPHDCSNWCADDDGVFVAAEHQAWFVDGKSGEIDRQFDIPATDKEQNHWGYIARHKTSLIGSVVKASAVYTRWWGASMWFDSTGGNDTHVVAGDKLFSMNAETGKLDWEHDGLVIHPTITIMDDRIYFIESKTQAHLDGKKRRLSLDGKQDHDIVCLDADSGAELWRYQLDPFAGHLSSLYLAGGGKKDIRALVLVASEATKKIFTAQAFDPSTGENRWSTEIDWEATHHGKHISRPAIQGDLIYLRPEVLQLADGETMHRGFPGGHGCSSYTASSNGIFTRLGETTWWDARTQKVNRFKRIRTDCWLSVIPAQGMLISAEGGGGCSCGSWLETSLGFLPRNVDEDLPDDE
ncbi:outer membrane protein assembly factor BamB family protein [Mariniblastus fucicola]|uniref:Outer membrane biogenesis protein BamB n=1 Tax=Mariniblastus fucicola TaxID=980251 RepID=A0A5B9PJT5_9BACT|nr:PQQ-binding-like beta-propeller repeat protein [Mariniblastus fucicola]QEG24936.1 outer membrane biogenesis protein BamB [Mariniblastus fucicola]